MKELKAKEIAKIINLESDYIRQLITDIARYGYIPDSLCRTVSKIGSGGKERKSYFFKENSEIYIQNFIFVYGIIGDLKKTFNILNHNLPKEEIKECFNEKRIFLEKKYSVHKNILYNYDNFISLLSNNKSDFKVKILETDNKLMTVKIIEEIEKNINDDSNKLLELVKAQIEMKELNQALINIEKIIEKDPENHEVYALKAKIYLNLMRKPAKNISHYKIIQECTNSSSGWNTYEELIQEEDFKRQQLYQNRVDTFFEIYKLLKKNKNHTISYDDKEWCKKNILNYLYNRYIYNKTGCISMYEHLNRQKEKFIHYKKTGEIIKEKRFYDDEYTDMILDILPTPRFFRFHDNNFHKIAEKEYIIFNTKEYIKENLMTLHLYFIFDFEKYIKLSKFYFNHLKKIDLEYIDPFILNEYLSHKHKEPNIKDYNTIFKEHFFMNLDPDEVKNFTTLLNEKTLEKTRSDNESSSLFTYKVAYFNELYQNKEHVRLLRELEISLNELSPNSKDNPKILYGYLRLIYNLASDEITSKNYEKSLQYLNVFLDIDVEKLKKINYTNLSDLSWKYEYSYVESTIDEWGTDILGNYPESFIFNEVSINNNSSLSIHKLLSILENKTLEDEQKQTIKKLKKHLNV